VYGIRTVQELLDHRHVRTMTYLHVMHRAPRRTRG